jgi:hypothetical protein
MDDLVTHSQVTASISIHNSSIDRIFGGYLSSFAESNYANNFHCPKARHVSNQVQSSNETIRKVAADPHNHGGDDYNSGYHEGTPIASHAPRFPTTPTHFYVPTNKLTRNGYVPLIGMCELRRRPPSWTFTPHDISESSASPRQTSTIQQQHNDAYHTSQPLRVVIFQRNGQEQLATAVRHYTVGAGLSAEAVVIVNHQLPPTPPPLVSGTNTSQFHQDPTKRLIYLPPPPGFMQHHVVDSDDYVTPQLLLEYQQRGHDVWDCIGTFEEKTSLWTGVIQRYQNQSDWVLPVDVDELLVVDTAKLAWLHHHFSNSSKISNAVDRSVNIDSIVLTPKEETNTSSPPTKHERRHVRHSLRNRRRLLEAHQYSLPPPPLPHNSTSRHMDQLQGPLEWNAAILRRALQYLTFYDSGKSFKMSYANAIPIDCGIKSPIHRNSDFADLLPTKSDICQLQYVRLGRQVFFDNQAESSKRPNCMDKTMSRGMDFRAMDRYGGNHFHRTVKYMESPLFGCRPENVYDYFETSPFVLVHVQALRFTDWLYHGFRGAADRGMNVPTFWESLVARSHGLVADDIPVVGPYNHPLSATENSTKNSTPSQSPVFTPTYYGNCTDIAVSRHYCDKFNLFRQLHFSPYELRKHYRAEKCPTKADMEMLATVDNSDEYNKIGIWRFDRISAEYC